MDNNSENINSGSPQSTLRCINIDCVFNSANDPEHIRNICLHPNVHVEAKFADITIAICSEFRSKKDYSFQKPSSIVDLKTGEKTEISGAPDINSSKVEKITTEDLEGTLSGDTKQTEIEDKREESITAGATAPVVVIAGGTPAEELSPSEIYNLTDRPGTDFLILKKLYQPNMKRGMVLSVIAHVFVLWMLYYIASPKESAIDPTGQQRIVVVEDIETPKFDPPDVDKQKEEELKQKEEEDKAKDNTADIKPKITPRQIKPRIVRPRDKQEDTNSVTHLNQDSIKRAQDSLLAARNKLDTNRLNIPDSLKSTYTENAIGMNLWYPKNWKLTDNRGVNLNQENFNGVIINTDSLSDDPGAVQIFILIDDPAHSNFNKTTFKNPFRMDDSTRAAFATDPMTTGSKRISYKFFVFSDDLGKKNVFVNSESKKELFDKYKPYIEAIVRSIKIVTPPSSDKDKKGP